MCIFTGAMAIVDAATKLHQQPPLVLIQYSIYIAAACKPQINELNACGPPGMKLSRSTQLNFRTSTTIPSCILLIVAALWGGAYARDNSQPNKQIRTGQSL
jgi:hypothetical protein